MVVNANKVVMNAKQRGAVNPPGGGLSKSARRRKRIKNLNGDERVENTILGELNAGRMTMDQPMSTIAQLKAERCEMDSNETGWYFKYLDPAGSVETGRAIGEFSKIPDGLCTFSVDAEIRTLTTLSVPGSDPSAVPLDGRVWSLTLLSYPMFRTGYIAVANTFDREVGEDIREALAEALNNLENFREVVQSDSWIPFGLVAEGWYYRISPLPPTFDLPDPVSGEIRTLTSYRLSYKGITVEHNAPTLVDQGFWIGGHVALDPSIINQDEQETVEVSSWLTIRNVSGSALGNAFTFTIRNLGPVTDTLPIDVTQNPLLNYFHVTSKEGTEWSYSPSLGNTWYTPFGVIFAEFGDTVTFTRTGAGSPTFIWTITSSHVGTTPIALNITFLYGQNASYQFFMDLPELTQQGGTAKAIEFPALTPAQVAANNPKMENELMKHSEGVYIVHKKIRKPVFQLTPASSFGPVQFTTPGYDNKLNHRDGSGIVDTIDENMSTASVCIRGISHANVLVVKLYQGWEGLTNVNTPFGQFGHTGLPKNEEIMTLVDNLNVRTTGIYPAEDNFLGMIARLAAGALKKLFTSEATAPMLGNIAKSAVETGVNLVQSNLSKKKKRKVRA